MTTDNCNTSQASAPERFQLHLIAERKPGTPQKAKDRMATGGEKDNDERLAAVFKTPEALSSWMRSLVEEWKERDDKVYCVARGGRAVAREAENPTEVRIFEVIEDQVGDHSFAALLDAGIKRFEELTGGSQIGGLS
jgi:hypothetical protein